MFRYFSDRHQVVFHEVSWDHQSQSVRYILWAMWISPQSFMVIDPVVVGIFLCGPRELTDIVIPSTMLPGSLAKIVI